MIHEVTHSHEDGTMIPKKDGKGRIYREVRCPNCRAFICDEYVRVGRLRFKCFRCGRIIIMEFRPRRERPQNKTNERLEKDTQNE